MNARVWTEQLARDEWGNEVMQKVASERLAADPTIDAVEVREHAGWYLTFARPGHIVGTANDMANLRPAAVEWCQQFSGMDYVGYTNRDDGEDRKHASYYPCLAVQAA